jgi:hypothetical protein
MIEEARATSSFITKSKPLVDGPIRSKSDASMVEHLPLAILAPWIQAIDHEKSHARVVVPEAIRARLSRPEFTEDREDLSRPSRAVLHLAPTHSAEVGAELTDEQIVAREFGNATWQKRVQRAMEEKGLLQDKRAAIDDETAMVGPRLSRDDWFSVRVDNLPEGFEPYDVERVLQQYGCDYYSRVVIPHDDDDCFKRFGFVKFERLRWALKFVEECAQMKVQNMVLNIKVVI